jgi:hypothetical protein
VLVEKKKKILTFLALEKNGLLHIILTSVSSSIVCLDLFEAVDAVSAPVFLFRL